MSSNLIMTLIIGQFIDFSVGVAEIFEDQKLGCYADSLSCESDECRFLPDYAVVLDPPQVLTRCADICRQKNFIYFGISASGKCQCRQENPNIHGLVGDFICHQICFGEAVYADTEAFRCGGDEAVSVYTTCSQGRFGVQCEGQCMCEQNALCQPVMGYCLSGQCAKGWMSAMNADGYSCSVRNCSFLNGKCLADCLSDIMIQRLSCSCDRGFQLVENAYCEDVNECNSELQNCSSCINSVGNVECVCERGFSFAWYSQDVYDDVPICVDVDECKAQNNSCGPNTTCVNTFGSYNCLAKSYFSSISDVLEDDQEANGFAYWAMSDGSMLEGQLDLTMHEAMAKNVVKRQAPGGNCVLLSANLLGVGATSASPVLYRRTQVIKFEADVKTSCPITSGLSYKWSLFRFMAGETESFIKSETSGVNYITPSPPVPDGYYSGVYIEKLIVYHASATDARYKEAKSQGYFRILKRVLNCKIFGASSTTVGLGDTVTIDASPSKDLDYPIGGTPMKYSWKCVPGKNIALLLSSRAKNDCIKDESQPLSVTGPIASYSTSRFIYTKLPQDYTFTVTCSKESVSDGATKIITLTPQKLSGNVDISCELNCYDVMDPSYDLVLRALCLNCKEGLKYAWSISPQSKGPVKKLFVKDTRGGLNDVMLRVNPQVFASAKTETYVIDLVVTFGGSDPKKASYSFVTVAVPKIGKCSVDPTSGSALLTQFTLSCSGSSGILPLLYSFTVHPCQGNRPAFQAEPTILYKGFNPMVSAVTLSGGDPNNGDSVCITAEVSGKTGASSKAELKLTVTFKSFSLSYLSELTNVINRLKTEGNIAAAASLLDQIAAATNTQVGLNVMQEANNERKQFREALAKLLSSLAVKSGDSNNLYAVGLQQCVFGLSKVTKKPEEFDSLNIVKTFNLMKLASDIGNSGENMKPEIKSDFYDASYRQLFQVASNLLTSSRSSSAQAAQAKDVVAEIMSVLEYGNKKLGATTFLNEKTGVKTDFFNAQILTLVPSSSQPTPVKSGKFETEIPAAVFSQLKSGTNAEFQVEMITFNNHPYWWSPSGADVTSGSVEIVLRQNGAKQDVSASLSSPVNFRLPNFPKPIQSTTSGTVYPDVVAMFVVNSTNPESMIAVVVLTVEGKDTPDGSMMFRLCEGKMEDIECQDIADCKPCSDLWSFDFGKLPISSTFAITPGKLSKKGNVIALQFKSSKNVSVDVSMKTTETLCRVWNKDSLDWDSKGCSPDLKASNDELIICNCQHLSHFGGGLLVKPNPLHIKDLAMFLKFWQNPVGLAVVLVLWLLFLLGFLWARRKDKQDALRALPIDLEDNTVNARYVYLVIIFTGSRFGSGTTSVVYTSLIGDSGSSVAHRLHCHDYKVLQRGAINIFIIRTVAPLGKLKGIRFWHYNLGDQPQWFVSRVIVHDSQARVSYHFICQSWLALDAADGIVDKTFVAATDGEVDSYQHLIVVNALRGINDKYLWFSLAARPPLSTFTRAQRLACCLALVLGYLLTNMMFFGVAASTGNPSKKLGPFTLKWVELAIAVESALIMIPVTMLIAGLFRNVRPKPDEEIIIKEWLRAVDALEKQKNPPPKGDDKEAKAEEDVHDENLSDKETANSKTVEHQPDSVNTSPVNANEHASTRMDPEPSTSTSEKSTLDDAEYRSILGSSESQSTTKFYNENETNISANTSAVDADKLASGKMDPEPSTSVSEKSTLDDDVEYRSVVGSSENQSMTKFYHENETNVADPSPPKRKIEKDDQHDEAEYSSAVESDSGGVDKLGCLPPWVVYVAWTLAIVVAIVFSFLIIWYSFSFGLQKSIDWLKTVVLSFVLGTFLKEPLKVIAIAIVLAIIFRKTDELDINKKDVITDESVRSLAAADYRHILHNNDLRRHPHYHPPKQSSVLSVRDMILQEIAMYNILWEILRYIAFIILALAVTNVRRDYNIFLFNNSVKRSMFQHRSFTEMRSIEEFWSWTNSSWLKFMYAKVVTSPKSPDADAKIEGLMGNRVSVLMRSPRIVVFPKGTVFPLKYLYLDAKKNITYKAFNFGMTRERALRSIAGLVETKFLGKQDGGAIIEAVSYCINADILSIILVIVGLSPAGGIEASTYIHSLKFHQFEETFQLIFFVLEIIYFVFAIWFLVYVIRRICNLGRKKYFESFWNVLDLCIAALSILLIVFYALLCLLLFDTARTYEQTRELAFTYAATLDIAVTALLGFVAFLGIFKLLHLFRFNPKLHGLMTVFSRASSKITFLLFYALCVFVLFVMLFHQLFCAHIEGFNSLDSSMLTLLIVLSKEFNYNELHRLNWLWESILMLACVIIFKILVIYMIFAVILSAFRDLKKLPQVARDAEFLKQLSNQFLGSFAFDKDKRIKGKKKDFRLEPSDEGINRKGV